MNINLKRFIGYLVYVVAFGYFVMRADYLHRYLKELYSSTFNPTYLWIFMSVFPVSVGLLLALPQLIKTSRQKGSWQIDWLLLFAVGLPSLFVAITPIICLAKFAQNWKVSGIIMMLNPNLITVAGIVFGFVLITSLDRQE